MDKVLSPKKLKYLTMQTIISCHNSFNELNNNHLLLPKRLFNEMVECGPSLIDMPKFNMFDYRFRFNENTEKFHKKVFYDHTYSKYFVIWVQSLNSDNLFKYLPIVIHFLEIYYVLEIDNIENIFLLCSKCLKLHLAVHPVNFSTSEIKIWREFKHKTYWTFALQSELKEKIQCKNSWCHYCKQVPLFQVANYNLCESIVGSTIHNCPKHFPVDEDDVEFIYCPNCYGSGFSSNFSFRKEIDINYFQ